MYIYIYIRYWSLLFLLKHESFIHSFDRISGVPVSIGSLILLPCDGPYAKNDFHIVTDADVSETSSTSSCG